MDSFAMTFYRLMRLPPLALLGAACGHSAAPVNSPPTPAAGTLPARIVADFSSGQVTLMGSVPSAAVHRRVLARANQLYGSVHVHDQIAVDPNVPDAPWVSTDAALLPLVDNTISDGQSAFDGRRLTLTGEIPSDTMKAQIAERVAKAAPGDVTIENHLQVIQQGTK